MMDDAFADKRSATANYDDADKAQRAVEWLLNIGVREDRIRQVALPGQASPAEAAASPKRRKGLVGSLVGLVRADDRPSGGGPCSVTVTDIEAAMYDTIVSILADEGVVQVGAPEPEAPMAEIPKGEPPKAGTLKTDMTDADGIRGLIGACLVDSASGRMLGSAGTGKIDLNLVAALNTDFMKTWDYSVDQLAVEEPLEEILMTLETQIHLFRPLERHNSVHLYIALDRATCNLGMARIQIKNLEANLAI